MDYEAKGYGSTVEKPKNKNYKIPIIIVVVVAIIAAVVIYYIIAAGQTISVDGDSLTTSNLSDYVDDMAEYFSIDAQDFTLYKDSSVSVENGSVTELKINTAMQYSTIIEYWQVKDDSDGIKMTYKGELDDDVQRFYTLPRLCAYLVGIDDILTAQLSSASYTAQFTASVSTVAQAGCYMWNGEAFVLLSSDEAVDCYPITVTTSDGAQYTFYAV